MTSKNDEHEHFFCQNFDIYNIYTPYFQFWRNHNKLAFFCDFVSFFVTCFFGKKTGFFGQIWSFFEKVTFLTLFFEIFKICQISKIFKRLFKKVPKSQNSTFSIFDQI
jgi:hypothetical protein